MTMSPSADEGLHQASTVECRICGASSTVVHQCEERMFGTREFFRYSECPACGTLQLIDVPDDLSPYYPPSYYSYKGAPAVDGRAERLAKTARSLFALHAPAPLLRLLPRRLRPGWEAWFRGTVPSNRALILDVGSGSGRLLTYLYDNGFTNLAGYDPFLSEEPVDALIPLYRSLPSHLIGRVDLAMLHHSLEHSLDPAGTLREVVALLAPGGHVLVRVPLADSFAWRHYATDWVALDPPRHIFLLTERSMALVAGAAGLTVVRAWRDSGSYQFWGSEQFRRGIVVEDERSLWRSPTSSIFSDADLREFDQRAVELNKRGDGDAGCFVLARSVP